MQEHYLTKAQPRCQPSCLFNTRETIECVEEFEESDDFCRLSKSNVLKNLLWRSRQQISAMDCQIARIEQSYEVVQRNVLKLEKNYDRIIKNHNKAISIFK